MIGFQMAAAAEIGIGFGPVHGLGNACGGWRVSGYIRTMPSKKRTRTYIIRSVNHVWRLYSDGTELSVFNRNYGAISGIAEAKAAIDTADGFKVEIYSEMPDKTLRLDWPKPAGKRKPT